MPSPGPHQTIFLVLLRTWSIAYRENPTLAAHTPLVPAYAGFHRPAKAPISDPGSLSDLCHPFFGVYSAHYQLPCRNPCSQQSHLTWYDRSQEQKKIMSVYGAFGRIVIFSHLRILQHAMSVASPGGHNVEKLSDHIVQGSKERKDAIFLIMTALAWWSRAIGHAWFLISYRDRSAAFLCSIWRDFYLTASAYFAISSLSDHLSSFDRRYGFSCMSRTLRPGQFSNKWGLTMIICAAYYIISIIRLAPAQLNDGGLYPGGVSTLAAASWESTGSPDDRRLANTPSAKKKLRQLFPAHWWRNASRQLVQLSLQLEGDGPVDHMTSCKYRTSWQNTATIILAHVDYLWK